MSDDDWISTNDAAAMLGISADALRKARTSGRHGLDGYKLVELEGANSTGMYRRDEIERYHAERVEAGLTAQRGNDVELSPAEVRALAAIVRLGPFADESGMATTHVRAAMRWNGVAGTVSTACRSLETYGFIKRNVNGKRTMLIAGTKKGERWLDSHAELVERLVVTRPEPAEPDEQPQQLDLPAEGSISPPERLPAIPGMSTAPALLAEPHSATERPVSHVNGMQGALDVDAGSIAQALLRQTVRVLSDSDVSTLTAERDALRAHNDVLVQRVDELTARSTAAETDLREAKAVLHSIEQQLMPMLGGSARFDWLDSQTRTDLLRLMGEAARWAT